MIAEQRTNATHWAPSRCIPIAFKRGMLTANSLQANDLQALCPNPAEPEKNPHCD
jgi:hypothetical protein